MAIDMLPVLFGRTPHVERFVLFLQARDVKVLNRDQWNSFLPFIQTALDDYSNHDDKAACARLLPCCCLCLAQEDTVS